MANDKIHIPVSRNTLDRASGAEKVDAILDAAASVFMELGFAAASVDDISHAYGATKGVIYYHFRNKSALFFGVQRRAMEMTRQAIEHYAHSTDSAPERLFQMAYAHSMLMMNQLSYLRVAAQGLELHLSGRTTESERKELEAITALRAANENLYVSVIAEGVETGSFRQVEPKLAVKPLLGALNWTSRWYKPRQNDSEANKKKIANEVSMFVLHALKV